MGSITEAEAGGPDISVLGCRTLVSSERISQLFLGKVCGPLTVSSSTSPSVCQRPTLKHSLEPFSPCHTFRRGPGMLQWLPLVLIHRQIPTLPEASPLSVLDGGWGVGGFSTGRSHNQMRSSQNHTPLDKSFYLAKPQIAHPQNRSKSAYLPHL